MSDVMTPSQQIIAEANETATVTDATGRTIVIRRLRGRMLARFIRACGPSADVQTYFGEAVIRAMVVSVDGRPVPAPTNQDQVDGLWDKVDTAATTAVVEWLNGQADTKAQ